MDCPNCKTPLKFLDIIKINHKRPYNCPICFTESGFDHSKGFLNLMAGLAGLAGVIFFYSFQWFDWLYALITLVLMLSVFFFIFIRYAKLKIIKTGNEK